MNIIQMTSYPSQTQRLILPDGSSVTMNAVFKPMQYGWFIRELVYNEFILKGFRICNSPNCLYQFKNQLPFGIACYSKDNREPTQQQDFSSANSILYLMTTEEVNQVTEFINGS